MSDATGLLTRYLKQRAQLGEHELVFEGHPLQALLDRPEQSSAPAAADALQAPAVSPGIAAPPLDSLHALSVLAGECTACGLASTRSNVVFGEGSTSADLVVVGEAPGAEEDRTGRPFVGRAGKLLNMLLASIGFPRESVYICNVLKCRPPGNRNPRPEEVASCNDFLERQLESVRPKAILACGTFSAQTLLDTSESIGRLRLGDHAYREIPLFATYHPAALLRNPAWIRPVWEDLQRLRRTIDERRVEIRS